jgi:hypothetical protein
LGQFMGVSVPVPATLFGKPILFTEKTPALGTAGDLILCDLSQYAIGLRQDVILDRSNAPGWTRDVESFRVILRADGASLWSNAVTPANGTNTLSWCMGTEVVEFRTLGLHPRAYHPCVRDDFAHSIPHEITSEGRVGLWRKTHPPAVPKRENEDTSIHIAWISSCLDWGTVQFWL